MIFSIVLLLCIKIEGRRRNKKQNKKSLRGNDLVQDKDDDSINSSTFDEMVSTSWLLSFLIFDNLYKQKLLLQNCCY